MERQVLQPTLKPVNSEQQDCECQTVKAVGVHRRQWAIYVEVGIKTLSERRDLGLEEEIGFVNAKKNSRKNICN